jgi:acetyltransferase
MPELEHVLIPALGEVTIRPLRADDLLAYCRFGAAVAPEDLRLRFGGPVRADAALLRRVLALPGVAFAAFDGTGEILGVGRLVEGEVAVTVRSAVKRHGLGRALLERLVRHAIEKGLFELGAYVLAENRPMLALARLAGFRAAGTEGNMVSIRLCLP